MFNYHLTDESISIRIKLHNVRPWWDSLIGV